MKYLFSLTIPLLLVAVALLPEADQNDFISYSQQYNTISALVEDCSGENALGAKCEAKCPGQGCACQTNIFKCNCYCVGGDSGPDAPAQANATQKLTLPSEEAWKVMLAVLATEKSDLSRDLQLKVRTLREYAELGNLAAYDALADEMDVQFMKLKSATLELFVEKFQS